MHVLAFIGDKATSWCTVFDYSVEVIVVAVSFFMAGCQLSSSNPTTMPVTP